MITFLGNPSNLDKKSLGQQRLRADPVAKVIRNGLIPPPKIITGNPLSYYGGVVDSAGNGFDAGDHWRTWSGNRRQLNIPNLDHVREWKNVDDAMFCGPLFGHYGHFLIECTVRLWWVLSSGYDGPLVFQTFRAELPAFIKDFFSMLRLFDRCVFLRPGTTGIRAKLLIVPEPSIEERGWITQSFLIPFRTVSATISEEGDARCLYLSRGSGPLIHNVGDEAEIINFLTSAGYTIVDTSMMSLRDQVALMKGAEHVTGIVGSAMHNILFASDRLKTVTYIARGGAVPATYAMIDQAISSHHTYYAYCANDGRIDQSAVCREIAALGFEGRY